MPPTPPAPSQLIVLPIRFSVVEVGLYRCASPTASQIPYLSTLGLKTIISLTPEHPIKPLLTFAKEKGIKFMHIGTTLWRPLSDWKPIRDEIVKSALEMILDMRYHPILLIDPLGIHHTGCVVGALRMMQGWNFASILVEYRAHSGPSKHRLSDEQYIEMFDPDTINIPPLECLPCWFSPESGSDVSEDEEMTEEEIVSSESEQDPDSEEKM